MVRNTLNLLRRINWKAEAKKEFLNFVNQGSKKNGKVVYLSMNGKN